MSAILAAIFLLFASCATAPPDKIEAGKPAPREGIVSVYSPFREFRGVWVATAYNIDWPSKPGLSTEKMKEEARTILDSAASLNLNAVLFQARPLCDAFYDSELEPWSSYITGEQGKAPENGFDPLEFWIEEAHARGLRLFAWINPFRAGTPSLASYAENSLPRAKPEMVRRLKKGYLWLDPGSPEARDHIESVVLDIAGRYEIEGVVLDDYFYPYPEYFEKGEQFPDSSSYDAYLAKGGTGTIGDFRRASVTRLIGDLGVKLRDMHPALFFGVSPFGIWRPGHPESISGKDSYAESFSDSRLWVSKGLVDFASPQLYWPIGRIPQSYPVLLGWWTRQSRGEAVIWPSIQPGYARQNDEQRSWETVAQVMIERGMENSNPGIILYNAKSILDNPGGFVDGLKTGPFSQKAAFPENPRIPASSQGAPRISVRNVENRLSLLIKDEERNFLEYSIWWIFRVGEGDESSIRKNMVSPCTLQEIPIPGDFSAGSPTGKKIAVMGIDRFGSSSAVRIESFDALLEGIPSAGEREE